MRILHVITGLQTGGAERMLARLIIAHKKNHNADHLVVSLTKGGPTEELLRNLGVTVYYCGLNVYNFPIAFYRLYQVIHRSNPDIVQTWLYHSDLFGGAAARMAGVSHVIWGVRSGDIAATGYNITVLVRYLCALLSSRLPSAIVFASSRSLKIHRALGYSCRDMLVIQNGYDFNTANRLEVTDRDEFLQYLGLRMEASRRVITLVARDHPVKGVDYFLNAANTLSKGIDDYAFILVGRGLDTGNVNLVTKISNGGLSENCLILGERADVLEILAHSDLCCMASVSEGFPNVVVEAMSVGTPCVVTDVGDAAQIVADTGIVVRPEDSEEIVRGIKSFFQLSKSAQMELRRRAKQRATENFSIENEFSKIIFE